MFILSIGTSVVYKPKYSSYKLIFMCPLANYENRIVLSIYRFIFKNAIFQFYTKILPNHFMHICFLTLSDLYPVCIDRLFHQAASTY